MSLTIQAQLLGTLFNPLPQQLNSKKQALSHLQSTFPFITQQNFTQYIEYLIQWTLFQVNSQCLIAFIYKLQDLQIYLQHKYPSLQQKMIMLLFYLLQQQDSQVRHCAIDVGIKIFKTEYGQTYLKKSIIQLLKNETNCSGFDSALVLFKKFRREFIDNNQFIEIINNNCFMRAFKTKKIFLIRMLQIAQQFIQLPLLTHLLQTTQHYISQPDQIIHCLGIKLRIILFAQSKHHNLLNLNKCIPQLTQYYQQQLIRTKYVMIELTEYIVEILPPHLIRHHFEYLKKNIDGLEEGVTELAIDKLKIMFQFVSKQERKELMNRLIKLDKQDYHIGDAIARNITDLLIQQQNQSTLIQHLRQFVSQQKDSVKLSFLKSFFNHQKSTHWYNFLLHILQQLMQNKIWRIRLQSLHILRKVIQIFPVQSWMFGTLKKLMFDKVARVRLETIKLLGICVDQENVRQGLVGEILEECKNGNYLYRETVLFFIKETWGMVPEGMKWRYQECVEVLGYDPIDNVKDIAFEIREMYWK